MSKIKSSLTAEQYRAQFVDQQESGLQQRCVTWFRWAHPQLLLFAIPNGGGRSKAEAAILIGEGIVSGIPDLLLAFPVHGKPGLFIEMKTMRKGSTPSDDQLKVQAHLRAVGYEVAMPRTYEEFVSAVTEYLSIHP